jgi:hypothetical protein
MMTVVMATLSESVIGNTNGDIVIMNVKQETESEKENKNKSKTASVDRKETAIVIVIEIVATVASVVLAMIVRRNASIVQDRLVGDGDQTIGDGVRGR